MLKRVLLTCTYADLSAGEVFSKNLFPLLEHYDLHAALHYNVYLEKPLEASHIPGKPSEPLEPLDSAAPQRRERGRARARRRRRAREGRGEQVKGVEGRRVG